jgi:FkbM family methyltransferase
METLRWLSNIPPENVYVVEPHPQSFKNIITKYPRFNTYNFAISNTEGVIDFNAIPHEYNMGMVGTSSTLKKNREVYKQTTGCTDEEFDSINPENWIKVMAIRGGTLLELINKPEIDMVKIDVEGLTYQVLSSFGENIRAFKMLHLEVESLPFWEMQATTESVNELLIQHGFEQIYYNGMYFSGRQGDSVWARI